MAALLESGGRGGGRGARLCSALGGALLAGSLSACAGEGGRSREASVVPAAQPATGGGAAAPENAGAPDANGELLLDDLSDGDAHFTAGSISGEWFTYSDGTSTVTPPDHTGL